MSQWYSFQQIRCNSLVIIVVIISMVIVIIVLLVFVWFFFIICFCALSLGVLLDRGDNVTMT